MAQTNYLLFRVSLIIFILSVVILSYGSTVKIGKGFISFFLENSMPASYRVQFQGI